MGRRLARPRLPPRPWPRAARRDAARGVRAAVRDAGRAGEAALEKRLDAVGWAGRGRGQVQGEPGGRARGEGRGSEGRASAGRSEAAGTGRRAPGSTVRGGGEGRAGGCGGGERACGALPSSGSRPPRRAHAGMASGARGPQAAPAQPCDAAQSGAPRAAGGSLKDARHRPQIPSDWCKVEGGRIPLPTGRGRGGSREVGPSREAGAWRSAAAEPTCPPRSAARALRGALGSPTVAGEIRRRSAGEVVGAPSLWLGGGDAARALPCPRESLIPSVWSPELGTAESQKPCPSRAGVFEVPGWQRNRATHPQPWVVRGRAEGRISRSVDPN